MTRLRAKCHNLMTRLRASPANEWAKSGLVMAFFLKVLLYVRLIVMCSVIIYRPSNLLDSMCLTSTSCNNAWRTPHSSPSSPSSEVEIEVRLLVIFTKLCEAVTFAMMYLELRKYWCIHEIYTVYSLPLVALLTIQSIHDIRDHVYIAWMMIPMMMITMALMVHVFFNFLLIVLMFVHPIFMRHNSPTHQ